MLTEQEARDAYAGDAPQNLLLARMRSAASIVAGLSERSLFGEEALDWPEYAEHVKSAEIIVGEYLFATGGYVKSDGVLDASTSYSGLADVKEAASAALGTYATPAKPAMGLRSVRTTRA